MVFLFSLMCLFFFGWIIFLVYFSPKKTEAAWFNDNWTYREAIPISTHSASESNVYDTFQLDTATLITAGKLQSSCQDIRVTDASGNILKYNVGRTNACNASNTTIDYLIPTMGSGAQNYYVYYGNPSAASADAGAFSQSICGNSCTTNPTLGSEETAPAPLAYWKFDDAQGTTASDSTSNVASGTLAGGTIPTWQTEDQCISGKCLFFDGATSTVTVSKVITSIKTVAMWVRPNSLSSGALIDLDGGTHYIDYNSSGVITTHGFTSPTYYINGIATTTPTLIVNRWNYVQITTGTGFASTSSMTIGKYATGSTFFKGFMDLVKLYPTALSANQAKADYIAKGDLIGSSENISNGNNTPSSLSDGLSGYWKEDEASNANAIDSSGNGTTLTDTNTVARAGGQFANGADFESTNSEYQFAADNASLSITGSLTLAAWIKPESVTAATLFDIAGKWDGANESYLLAQFGTELRCYIDSSSNYVETTNASLATATWYNTACVYDSATSTVKIYVNGVQKTTTTTGTIPSSIGDDAGRFQIGAEDSSTSAANFYDGIVDEIRVYSRTLSSADVINLYNFAIGPVGKWDFEEGTGTTANDTSGNSNQGTITAGAGGYVPGKYGKGYNFDKADTKIDAGSGASLDDLKNGAGLTAEAWIYPKSVGEQTANGGVIIGKATGPTNTVANGWFLLLTTSNAIKFTADGSTDLVRTTGTTAGNVVTLNTWNHVAVTWDGSVTATNVHIYINGVEANTYATSTDGVNLTSDATPTLIIGNDSTSADTFDGFIDNVRVYNYPRSLKLAIEDMNAGHPAPGSPIGTPYGYWKFNEGADNTCSGGANDACNSGNGGNGLDGAESNMATAPSTSSSGWQLDGKFGKALAFDGTNDFVAVGDLTGTELATQVTWSFWTKPGTLATAKCIFCKVNTPAGTPAQSSWAIMTDSSDSSIVRFIIANGAADVSQYGSSPTGTLVNGTWTHVVGVYDGTLAAANRLKIYVNGRPVTTTITGTIPTSILASTATATFGRASSDASALYNGIIDEPKVYLGPLTADQAKIDMNYGQSQQLGAAGNSSTYQLGSANQEYCVPGDSTSCVGPAIRWNFEEGTGTTTNDITGNGHTGTITIGGTGTNTTSAQAWVPGKIGKAFSADGSDDDLDSTATIDLSGTSIITVEFWANIPAYNDAGAVLVEDGGIFSTVNTGFLIDPDGGGGSSAGKLEIDMHCASGDVALSFTRPSAGAWHHWAVVLDKTQTFPANIVFYADGVKQTGATVGTATNTCAEGFGDNDFHVMSRQATSLFLKGKVDELKVFKYTRSAAQIAYDYNKGAPLGFWKFDECQGSTTNDSSGNSNSGTITIGAGGTQTAAGTCTTSGAWFNGVSGKRSYSLNFDGNDDYDDVGDLTNTEAQTKLSWSFWVKPGTLSTDACLFCKMNGAATQRSWAVTTGSSDSSKVRAYVFTNLTDALTTNFAESPTGMLANGTWTHVTVVYDGTLAAGSRIKFYINGIARTASITGTISSAGSLASSSNARFGAASDAGAGKFYSGQIDDARVYNYPLTSTQDLLINNYGALNFGPVTGAP